MIGTWPRRRDRCERGLADLKRIAAQVVAIQLDEVEGIEKYAPVSALVPDEIERGNAVVIAGDSFAVDNAEVLPPPGDVLDNAFPVRRECGFIQLVGFGDVHSYAHPVAVPFLKSTRASQRTSVFLRKESFG